MEERPYSSRLKKVGELLDQDVVSREEVVSELGGWTLTDIFPSCPQRATGTARALCRAPGRAVHMVPAALRISVHRNSSQLSVCLPV